MATLIRRDNREYSRRHPTESALDPFRIMDALFGAEAPPPPDQPNVEIALLNPLGEGMHYDDEAKAAFKVLLEKGALGAGVLYTPDCHATYEELKAKSVHFKSEPKDQFYGIEAIITDGVGNWFSMSQPK